MNFHEPTSRGAGGQLSRSRRPLHPVGRLHGLHAGADRHTLIVRKPALIVKISGPFGGFVNGLRRATKCPASKRTKRAVRLHTLAYL